MSWRGVCRVLLDCRPTTVSVYGICIARHMRHLTLAVHCHARGSSNRDLPRSLDNTDPSTRLQIKRCAAKRCAVPSRGLYTVGHGRVIHVLPTERAMVLHDPSTTACLELDRPLRAEHSSEHVWSLLTRSTRHSSISVAVPLARGISHGQHWCWKT